MKALALGAVILIGVAACASGEGRDPAEAHFVRNAASEGMLEVQLAASALSHAHAEALREFAAAMIADHRRAYRGLEKAAARAELELPDDLIQQHQDAYIRLAGLRGEEFDRSYLRDLIERREVELQAYRAEVARSRSDVSTWAADSLPTMEKQLARARELAGETRDFAAVPAER